MQSYGIKDTQTRTPFVHTVQTTAEKRVYTFQPDDTRPFLISVDLRRGDYGAAFVEIVGQAEPNLLIAGILFVEKNEFRYAEMLDRSGD